MRPAKIDDQELLNRLSDVFRRHGYEGASLSRLVEATGLQRASLYHRFSGGKDEMAQAILGEVDREFLQHSLAPLDGDLPYAERAREMASRLRDFYHGGGKSCVLDTLSLGGTPDEIREHLAATLSALLGAMAGIAESAGCPTDEARRRAEDAIIDIQGALVLARVLEDCRPFERVLESLPDLLTSRSH